MVAVLGALPVARLARVVLCALVAVAAAAGLRDDRRPEAGPVDPALLEAPAGEQARAVVATLERRGAGGLVSAFEMLGDRSPQARAGAAAYLGRRGSRRAVSHLVRRLRDDEAQVRIAAARALGAIGDPRALPFLERAIGSEPLDVAEAALLAARRIRARHPDAGG